MTKLRFSIAVLLAAFLLAGCGSSSNPAEPPPPPPPAEEPEPEPEPTAYETGAAAIAVATTEEAAQAAYNAVDLTAVSGDEAEKLQAALESRLQEFADDKAAMERQALVDAAMCEDATAACVAKHDALIAALQADVDELNDPDASPDATNAQQTAAQTALTTAKAARAAVEMELADVGRTTKTGGLVGDAIDKANELEEDPSADAITAAKVAIEVAEEAIGEDDDSYNERIMKAKDDVARAEERNKVDKAIMDARTAIDGLAADADAAAVAAVQEKLTAAKMAVYGNDHLTDAEETSHNATIADLQRGVNVARKGAEDDAEKQRMAKAEEERKANEDRAATAAKLYAAISPASGLLSGETPEIRFAEINAVAADDSTPRITVNYGGALETEGQPNQANLNLDKDTPVADHRDWEGNRYVEKDADGNVITEAIVYSDVSPTMGKKFGGAAANDEFEYALNDGLLTIDGTTAEYANVGGSRFDQSAGVKEFALPDPNPTGADIVVVPGTFHGVSGTYSCTPTADNTCAANKAATGFALGLTLDATNVFTPSADAWTFKPANANARVTDGADTLYAVYGWWFRTPAGNGAWTASAFDGYYGEPVAIAGLDALLNGSATYRGGAAGKYALSSSTGGDNDAGHFTARATLEADFDTEMITGTIDNFMGVGGAKNWSVELNKSAIGATGLIRQSDDDNTNLAAGDPGAKTKWTIGDDAAAASGHWKGNFRDLGENRVPVVVTGDFYTEFGNSGKMVGAFGAKTE